MEILNNVIIYIMVFFMVLGAIDRMFDQFGGSEKVLGKIGLGFLGRGIAGAGTEFEAGFGAMGPVALGMVGVIVLTPVLGSILGPAVIPVYKMLGADPSMFAGTILANDMGGFFLSRELTNDAAAGLYSGVILASMLGVTVSFTIPVGFSLISKEDRPFFAQGVLIGLVTIPIGCIVGGLVAMNSDIIMPSGEPAVFSMKTVLVNMIPVILFSAIIGGGLKFFPKLMVMIFNGFAKFLVVIITIGLAVAVIERLTGFVVIPGMDPMFMIEGDIPGIDMRAMEVIGAIGILLLGAYPMVLLFTRWFKKPLMAVAGIFGIDAEAAVGMIGALANILLMIQAMSKMSKRGKVIAMSFSVSAAWTLGDHLGFTAANKPDMIFAMVAAKLVAGITAMLLAMWMVRHWKRGE